MNRIQKIFSGAFILLCWTPLWSQQNKDTPSLELLVEWLSGTFQNTIQRSEMDSSISTIPARSGVWLNELCLQQSRIDAPALGTHVLYLTWKELDCIEGVINRHRLWSFRKDDKGQIYMAFYAFPTDCPVDDHLSKDRLQEASLVSYPSGCIVTWSWQQDHFLGLLNESECHTIAQASGRVIHLGAEIKVWSNGFQYTEQGVYEQGESAFKVPGWPFYQFDKKTP
jgi:hypothetical protein